jgi:hypothetical protein
MNTINIILDQRAAVFVDLAAKRALAAHFSQAPFAIFEEELALLVTCP